MAVVVAVVLVVLLVIVVVAVSVVGMAVVVVLCVGGGGWVVLLLAAVVVVLAVLLVLAAVMVAVAVALKMKGASHLSSSTPKRGGKVKQFFCGRRVAAGVCAQRRPSADAAPSPGCNRQQTKHREHTSAHGSQ